jgi:hypothetical protein
MTRLYRIIKIRKSEFKIQTNNGEGALGLIDWCDVEEGGGNPRYNINPFTDTTTFNGKMHNSLRTKEEAVTAIREFGFRGPIHFERFWIVKLLFSYFVIFTFIIGWVAFLWLIGVLLFGR